MTKIDKFKENCEILKGIGEEYGLGFEKGHYIVIVTPDANLLEIGSESEILWFDEEDLYNPNWDNIRERLLSLSLNTTFR